MLGLNSASSPFIPELLHARNFWKIASAYWKLQFLIPFGFIILTCWFQFLSHLLCSLRERLSNVLNQPTCKIYFDITTYIYKHTLQAHTQKTQKVIRNDICPSIYYLLEYFLMQPTKFTNGLHLVFAKQWKALLFKLGTECISTTWNLAGNATLGPPPWPDELGDGSTV
jgi:hypothetical protein